MNIDMLVFGEDWGKHPSSTQHLMKHLIPEQEILWVNSLGLRKPKFTQRDMHRVWNKLSALLHSPFSPKTSTQNQQGAQPSIIQPCTIPWPGSQMARRINQKILTQQLKPLLQHSKKRPLLWTSLPSAVDVVGKLDERAAVYYCGDDFSALDGVDHGPIRQMELELVSKSALIITASKKLAEKFPAHKTIVLPHGVDSELFTTPTTRAADLPFGPVAGFYGSIAGWFDQPLMIDTARHLPHWTFVLIGPASCNIERLLKEPNITWLGPKPHHELPRYSQHWDVGLLPFLHNRQIEACNPLKLREYLAAGSHVVSTEFPALDGYRDLIDIRNDAGGFAHAIESTYQSNSQQLIRIKQQRINQESWGKQAGLLKDILHAL
jgi:glycosyltransferase involved in cell wall biosynthesis